LTYIAYIFDLDSFLLTIADGSVQTYAYKRAGWLTVFQLTHN